MSKTTQCEVTRVSEDFYDYSRENYDYVQMELHYENFERAPPISVAEYRARTLEVLPKGIFDENEVPGILIAGKDTRYYDDFMGNETKELTPEKVNQIEELNGNDEIVSVMNHKEEPPTKIKNKSKNQENQKKKKKKYKPFDFTSSSSQSSLNQMWRPNFADQFKDDEAFPPL